MTVFTQKEADALAWVHVATRNRANDKAVEPGDFATRRQESERWADFGCQPIACCCMPRRVDLTDDRSDFTREAFTGI